jgi:hypothetical protein
MNSTPAASNVARLRRIPLAPYCIAPAQCENARLLGFLRLPFAQAYPGPTAVFIDELNTGGLQRAANCQIVSRCHRGVTLSEFSTSDRAQAHG